MESLFAEPQDKKDQGGEAKQQKPARKKSSSGKDFSKDLNAFLQSTLDEAVEEYAAEKQSRPETTAKKRSRRPDRSMGGLDALIRNTLTERTLEVKEKPVRRLSLNLNSDQMEKLRQIARTKRATLRSILKEVIAEYLEQYEREDDPSGNS